MNSDDVRLIAANDQVRARAYDMYLECLKMPGFMDKLIPAIRDSPDELLTADYDVRLFTQMCALCSLHDFAARFAEEHAQ